MKKCTKCGVEKPLSEFHKKVANKDGFQNSCKICRKVENRDNYVKNKPQRLLRQKNYYENNYQEINGYTKTWRKTNKGYCKNYDLKRKYGITIDDKNKMVSQQNNRCAICKTTFKNSLSTHVDHCHTTGIIRAILCHGCNTALGGFKDNIDILKSAVKYLKKYSSKSVEK